MSYKIIDGQKISEEIKDDIVKEISQMKGVRPNLAIILVGEREDSKLYVSLKEKEAKKVGVDTHLYKCDEDITEKQLLEIVEYLNNDDLIDAILVQMPLPKHLDAGKIVNAVKAEKDVDGFGQKNLKKLLAGDKDKIIPPVYGVVLRMLDEIDFSCEGKNVVVLSNSDIFGKNLEKVLEKRKAKTKLIHPDDKNLKQILQNADLIISAIGKKEFIKKEMVKDNAVIIDIGISKEGKRVYGDVDFKNVCKKTSYITPVPGGVGPLTIAMTFKNTLKMHKKRKNS